VFLSTKLRFNKNSRINNKDFYKWEKGGISIKIPELTIKISINGKKVGYLSQGLLISMIS